MVEIVELEKLGMTKGDLAKALGIRPQTIYRWKKLPGYVEAYLRLSLMIQAAGGCEAYKYGTAKD